MFGKNEIVGARHFNGEERLLVTSMFMTLQGEGPYSGMPAVFVRLAKCNLACSFCDTYFDSGEWKTIADLQLDIDMTVSSFYGDQVYNSEDIVLVITGGEPTLQPALETFLNRERGVWKAIQIESNGIPKATIPEHVTVVVSPKCAEKNGAPTRYLRPRPDMLARADCLKFVMEADPTSPYSVVPDWALTWRRETGKEIYVSPMNVYNIEPQKAKEAREGGTSLEQRSTVEEVISFWEPGLLDVKANQLNHETTAAYAIRNFLRFQVQTHLLASVA